MKPAAILYTPRHQEFDLICQLSEILQAHLSYTIYKNNIHTHSHTHSNTYLCIHKILACTNHPITTKHNHRHHQHHPQHLFNYLQQTSACDSALKRTLCPLNGWPPH